VHDPIETIIATLAPVIGEHMSRAVVTGSLERMGLTRDRVSAAELGRLVHQLGLGLNVFVGRVKAKALIEELNRKLEGKP